MSIHPFLIDPLTEPPSRLAWRDTPINHLIREQLIEALTGAYRNIAALRDERNEAQNRAAVLSVTVSNLQFRLRAVS